MRRDLEAALGAWLAEGERQMGEVLIRAHGDGWALCHVEDAGRDDLMRMEPREVSLLTEAGEYRPLKTAPNLRRGWRCEAADLPAVRRALDLLYPAMLGVLLDFQEGRLAPVPLRETLARQSGMYAITRKLRDEQAQGLIGGLCRSDGGCLKTILWEIAPGVPVATLPVGKFDVTAQQARTAAAPVLPMLCHEGCNLLVAKAREVVKAEAAR